MSYESLKNDSDIRWSELNSGNVPWVRVSDAMCCGSSLGSEEIIEILNDYSKKNNIQMNIDTVGCHGICYAGTIIDVLIKDKPRIFWGYVTTENVEIIIDSYLNKKKIIKNNLLGSLGDQAIKDVPKFSDLPGIQYQKRI